MSAEPVGESTGEVRPLRISPELARELLRVLREVDLELPEDSTVLAGIVEPHRASQPAPPQGSEEGIEGLIGVLGHLDAPADASERIDSSRESAVLLLEAVAGGRPSSRWAH
jgi:hypothetical protein